MGQQILVGFHAVIARIRQAPDSLTTVYYDFSRRDRRMKDFIESAQSVLGRRLHQADSARLRQLAGHEPSCPDLATSFEGWSPRQPCEDGLCPTPAPLIRGAGEGRALPRCTCPGLACSNTGRPR